MTQIIVNGRFLTQQPAGVHRFAFEMCCALQKKGVEVIALTPNKSLYFTDIHFVVERVGKRSSHYWEQIELPRYMKKHYAGRLLVCFSGLSPLFYRRSICTIHDLSFLERPEWFSKSYYLFYRVMTPLVAKRVRHIITVSEFSRERISALLGVDSEKISVIGNAVSERMVPSGVSSVDKYLLAVSSLDPRKNYSRLISAFNLLSDKEIKLYVVGTKNRVFGNEQLESSDRISFLGYKNDVELADCYSNAVGLVYPSLYEGFGVPPLEAMRAGCPVLVSSIPPLQEVCGDAALYCNPLDINDISNKMETLISDMSLRSSLIARGREREKLYSWQLSAQCFVDLLSRIE